MKKLIFTAATIISFATMTANYDKEFAHAIIHVMQQDSFIHELVLEALKKEKNNFDDIEVLSVIADLWIETALKTMRIKKK